LVTYSIGVSVNVIIMSSSIINLNIAL